MAASWRDGYVKCPYYLRDNRKNRIVCQGIMDGTDLALTFSDQRDYRIQMDTFCQAKYKNCEVYRMLEEIYGED